jgi:hypothetical protein
MPRWGTQPYQLIDPQHFATGNLRQSHRDALYRFGEYSVYLLLWDLRDHENGLVGRCPECYLAYGDIADTFGQSSKEGCVPCVGTTFEGGIKALLVRPSIWDISEEADEAERRGEINKRNSTVQSTEDFRARIGDYILRADGSRWKVEGLATNLLRTGFDHPTRAETSVGFNYAQVVQEDPTTVIYKVPPSGDELVAFLDPTHPHFPGDFSTVETILGNLLEIGVPYLALACTTWTELLPYRWSDITTSTWDDLLC